jgi:hypothetical protein
MKKYIKQHIQLIIAVLFSIGAIYSCTKRDSIAQPNSFSVFEAKQWLNKNGSEQGFIPGVNALAWDKADVTKTPDNVTVIGVPYTDTFANGWYKKLVFAKIQDSIYAIRLIIEPTAEYVQTHGSTVDVNDFSGAVLQTELNCSYVKGIRYENGNYKTHLFLPTSSSNKQVMLAPAPPQDGNGEVIIDGMKLDDVIVYTTSGSTSLPLFPISINAGDSFSGISYNSGYNYGGGGNGGYSGGSLSSFNPNTLFKGLGPKPIKEYKTPCNAATDMWNSYPNNEVYGYLTADGQVIMTNITGYEGGEVGGLYNYNGSYYYPYPMIQGAPANNYTGMTNNGSYYFIPVVASIHTHTPCRVDGTNGLSQNVVGDDDAILATKYPGLRNYVIGCGAIGTFDGNHSTFQNIKTGDISSICSTIK